MLCVIYKIILLYLIYNPLQAKIIYIFCVHFILQSFFLAIVHVKYLEK